MYDPKPSWHKTCPIRIPHLCRGLFAHAVAKLPTHLCRGLFAQVVAKLPRSVSRSVSPVLQPSPVPQPRPVIPVRSRSQLVLPFLGLAFGALVALATLPGRRRRCRNALRPCRSDSDARRSPRRPMRCLGASAKLGVSRLSCCWRWRLGMRLRIPYPAVGIIKPMNHSVECLETLNVLLVTSRIHHKRKPNSS